MTIFEPDFDSNTVDTNGVHNNDVDVNGVDIPTFEKKRGWAKSFFFQKMPFLVPSPWKWTAIMTVLIFSTFTASSQQVNSQWTASEQPVNGHNNGVDYSGS